jgi:membrane protein DedA with SNARE-associated domain
MDHLLPIISQYGIYAVFVLCTIEGDMTLLISGVLAHNQLFGNYSFFKVLLAGTLGGMFGDNVAYLIGRVFRNRIKSYKFYKMARPRIERLINKFGGFAIVISKYIYGIRAGICVFYGIGKMPYLRFLIIDSVSCFLWAFILAGAGFFFSGAIIGMFGNLETFSITLFVIAIICIVLFYFIERYWLSEKVEEVKPETIHRIEEKIHDIEEVASEKLHDLGERLHLTHSPDREENPPEEKKETSKAAKK